MKNQIEQELRNNIYQNIDKIIDDFEHKKIEILQQTTKNKAISQKINELDAEYVDFIEIIDEDKI